MSSTDTGDGGDYPTFIENFLLLADVVASLAPLFPGSPFSLCDASDAMWGLRQSGRLGALDQAAVDALSGPTRQMRVWGERIRQDDVTGRAGRSPTLGGNITMGDVTRALWVADYSGRDRFGSDAEQGAASTSWTTFLTDNHKVELARFAVQLRRLRDVLAVHLTQQLASRASAVLTSLTNSAELRAAVASLGGIVTAMLPPEDDDAVLERRPDLTGSPATERKTVDELTVDVRVHARIIQDAFSRLAYGGPAIVSSSDQGVTDSFVRGLRTSFHREMMNVRDSEQGWTIQDALRPCKFDGLSGISDGLGEQYLELFRQSAEAPQLAERLQPGAGDGQAAAETEIDSVMTAGSRVLQAARQLLEAI